MTKIECHRNTVQQVINKMEREHSKSSCSQSIYKFNKKVGSTVHGIFQARILELVAISYSRGSSQARIEPTSISSPALSGRFFTTAPLGKPKTAQMSFMWTSLC